MLYKACDAAGVANVPTRTKSADQSPMKAAYVMIKGTHQSRDSAILPLCKNMIRPFDDTATASVLAAGTIVSTVQTGTYFADGSISMTPKTFPSVSAQ